MSKSIYEETLTELETWKSINALDQEQLKKIDAHIEVMKKAIKQEKLLELYKEKSEILSQLRTVSQLPMADNLRLIEIEKQIKELEK